MTEPQIEAARIDAHHRVAARLAQRSDDDLIAALSRTSAGSDGHAVVHLEQGDTPLFVKLLPLSELELKPSNRESTANIFELPAYFHYRIGSCGFSAWRELEIHRAANAWVMSGECPRFPLLHHWRVLPIRTGLRHAADLERWGDSPAIRDRFESISQASSSLVLFVEHMPQTLSAWLQDELAHGRLPLSAITKLQAALVEQLGFMHSQGVLHMDAHFGNLLMHGPRVHWSDFGLSLSRDFDLGADERDFFVRHADFDEYTVITSLVHAVISHYDPRDEWRAALRDLSSGRHDEKHASIPAEVRAYLVRNTPLVLEIGEFYSRLLNDLTTGFPDTHLRNVARG